jgi:hypothetical protein
MVDPGPFRTLPTAGFPGLISHEQRVNFLEPTGISLLTIRAALRQGVLSFVAYFMSGPSQIGEHGFWSYFLSLPDFGLENRRCCHRREIKPQYINAKM